MAKRKNDQVDTTNQAAKSKRPNTLDESVKSLPQVVVADNCQVIDKNATHPTPLNTERSKTSAQLVAGKNQSVQYQQYPQQGQPQPSTSFATNSVVSAGPSRPTEKVQEICEQDEILIYDLDNPTSLDIVYRAAQALQGLNTSAAQQGELNFATAQYKYPSGESVDLFCTEPIVPPNTPVNNDHSYAKQPPPSKNYYNNDSNKLTGWVDIFKHEIDTRNKSNVKLAVAFTKNNEPRFSVSFIHWGGFTPKDAPKVRLNRHKIECLIAFLQSDKLDDTFTESYNGRDTNTRFVKDVAKKYLFLEKDTQSVVFNGDDVAKVATCCYIMIGIMNWYGNITLPLESLVQCVLELLINFYRPVVRRMHCDACKKNKAMNEEGHKCIQLSLGDGVSAKPYEFWWSVGHIDVKEFTTVVATLFNTLGINKEPKHFVKNPIEMVRNSNGLEYVETLGQFGWLIPLVNMIVRKQQIKKRYGRM